MNRIAFAVLVAAAASADAPKLPSTEEMLAADPQEAKFNPITVPGLPPGAVAAPIAVNPETKAPIGYTRVPAKYHFPRHWHSQTEYSVLISGSAMFEMGGKPYELVPGSYVVIPAKTEHELTCGAASDCLLLTRRAGPADFNFVK
jgi:quercetin dioxygenase-like cupin family protein